MNPTSLTSTSMRPSGLENLVPAARGSYISKSVLLMNNLFWGESPAPCPLPRMGWMDFAMLNKSIRNTKLCLEVVFGFGKCSTVDYADLPVHAIFATDDIGNEYRYSVITGCCIIIKVHNWFLSEPCHFVF
jgi:hypothetical protein